MGCLEEGQGRVVVKQQDAVFLTIVVEQSHLSDQVGNLGFQTYTVTVDCLI